MSQKSENDICLDATIFLGADFFCFCFLLQHLSIIITFIWENERKWVSLARKSVTLVKLCSFFYNWLLLVSVTVFTRRKNLSTKKKRFTLAGKSVSTSQNEGFCWNRRFHHLLITLMISNSSKIALTKKNIVSIGRKFVCASRIKDIEKCAFTIRKHGTSSLKNFWKNRKKMVSTSSSNMVCF